MKIGICSLSDNNGNIIHANNIDKLHSRINHPATSTVVRQVDVLLSTKN